LAGFGQDFGLDKDMAVTLGRAFGSGMGMGNICGALCGSFMILGFKYQGLDEEQEARYKTYDLVREFVSRFKARRGSIVCKELLGGVDLATREGRQEAVDRQLFTGVCPDIVKDAAQILDDLL
jgi:C_GCAxxG_C_C family probable redox protein